MTVDMPVPPPPPPTPAGPTPDEKTWGTMAHASALIAMAVGGLMALGPLVVWLVKKNESAYVDYHGKEALNFQITMLIACAIGVGIGLVTCGFGLILVVPLVLVAGVANIVLVIMAAVAANRGEMYRYPFAIRLVK